MLLFSLLFFIPLSGVLGQPEWWRANVVYQVYPRSFQDSDGDGNGDIRGIIDRVPYLKQIGVETVWVSPIMDSPWQDMGYDVSNFRVVHPTFGTLADVRELIDLLHANGMRFIMDFIPNHTSDRHPWFLASRRNQADRRDFYVWRNPRSWNGSQPIPPNNWQSEFGGSAWEFVPERRQFYLHQFAKFQPDLNYDNPRVLRFMQNEMRFWLDLGVDGFRVDAVPFISEDPLFRDEPVLPGCSNRIQRKCHDLIHTENQPGTFNVMRAFDDMVRNEYNNEKFLFAEAYAPLNVTMRYYRRNTAPFNFQFIRNFTLETNASALRTVIDTYMSHLPRGAWPNWVAGNHDNDRVGSRFSEEYIDLVNMLVMLLPGSAITYQGEEIGMVNMNLRQEEILDISDRDPERTPMQWACKKRNSGFSTARRTWLPVNPNYWRLNVDTELSSTSSHLSLYMAMAHIREDLGTNVRLQTSTFGTWIFGFTRQGTHGRYFIVLNLSSINEEVSLLALFPNLAMTPLTVAVSSTNAGFEPGTRIFPTEMLHIPPRAGIVMQI